MKGQLVTLAAHSPKHAVAGAEITREIVSGQRKAIRVRNSYLAHIKAVALKRSLSSDQKLARICELLAKFEEEK